jgi:hypothetical protein
VRLDILEAIQDLDEVLADIERAGGTISDYKSAFICNGLGIVVFVCDCKGCHLETEKVQKIIKWPACHSVTEAQAFIGIWVYYRAWILDFSILAEPIFPLFRSVRAPRAVTATVAKKEGKQRKKAHEQAEFAWGNEQAVAMKRLTDSLVMAPALLPLTYTPEADGLVVRIVLGVDACGLGFGTILQQEDRDGKRHPARYESRLWTPAETCYDAVKLQCRGLLRALEKFCYYVYSVQFLVEIDARTLVHQLNQPTSDLSGAIVGRWLAYIRLFTFDINHVPGTKRKRPDDLSRRPGPEEELWELEEAGEEAVRRLEEFVDGALDIMSGKGFGDAGTRSDEWECSGFCTNRFHSFFCLPLSLEGK